MYYLAVKTPLGEMYLEATDKGISGLFWKKPKSNTKPTSAKAKAHLEAASKQLAEYFKGERKKFNLKYDLHGTDFQKKVWKTLLKIPYGKTCSYGELAEKVGAPKAYRAVGSANGKNPVCLLIPCHRVIASNGSLGGYSGRGGLKTKQFLLSLEKH